MAEFTGTDLKKLRETQNITAAQLAERISCDATTIYRYESGKLKPNPDVMYEICEALRAKEKWQDWMHTEYPTSYGRVHPAQPQYDFKGAVMSLYAGIADLQRIEIEVMQDGADGKLDRADLSATFGEKTRTLLQSAQRVTNLM